MDILKLSLLVSLGVTCLAELATILRLAMFWHAVRNAGLLSRYRVCKPLRSALLDDGSLLAVLIVQLALYAAYALGASVFGLPPISLPLASIVLGFVFFRTALATASARLNAAGVQRVVYALAESGSPLTAKEF